jgi:zinc protease
MKRLVAAFVCLAAVALAHAGVKIEHWQTAAGARVYFAETHELPILDVQVDFTAGSAYDAIGKAGLATLTHRLLDAGAGDLGEEEIAAKLSDIAAHLSGGVDHDRASLALRTLSSAGEREKALDLLRLVLTRPVFPEAMVARERARTVAAIREAETQPDAIANRRFAAATYPNHPYGATSTAEGVAAISREDIVGFYGKHYAAPRAVVAIIGDVSRAEAERIALFLTADLPAGEPEVALAAVELPQAATLRFAHPATQSHVLIGLPAMRRTDPDYFPLLVGNYSLGGGGFVSRLVKEVREKRGYAYSVYSHFEPRRQAGPFMIGLQTKRDQVDAAIQLVGEILDGFVRTGPSAVELAAAKKNLIDGFGLRMDSNAKLLGYLSTIGFYGLPLTYLDDFPGKVAAVTAAQVQEAFARHVRRDNLVTVVVAAD